MLYNYEHMFRFWCFTQYTYIYYQYRGKEKLFEICNNFFLCVSVFFQQAVVGRAYTELVANCKDPKAGQIIHKCTWYVLESTFSHLTVTLYFLYTVQTPFGPHYDLCTFLFKCTYQVHLCMIPALGSLQLVTSSVYAPFMRQAF